MISLKCTFDLVSVLEISKNLIKNLAGQVYFLGIARVIIYVTVQSAGPSVGLKSELEMESPGGQRLLPL